MLFGPALAGAFQGQRDYDVFLREKALQDQLIQQNQMALDAQRWQSRNQGQIDQAAFGILSRAPVIQPPPQVQTPQPGQSSQPMQQPEMAPGVPRFSSMGQQGTQATQQPPAVPPYQSLVRRPQQAMAPVQIPPPPQAQPQGMPGGQMGGGMSLEQAAQQIKAMGITDPRVAMTVLDKLTPYLNQEAKNEAAFLRAQNAAMTNQIRQRGLDQKAPLVAAQTEKASAEAKAVPVVADAKARGADAAMLRAQKGRGSGSTGQVSASGAPANDAIEVAAWDYLMKNAIPPKRGGTYEKVMAYVGKLAKDNGMSVQEIVSASADVKSKLAAKKNFEVRAQNMQRAENQLELEIPVLEKAMSQLDPSRFPALANLELAALRQSGDPRVTQLDQAAETVFREFEGIVTGNPGTLNVQDVQNAHESYMNARTPQQMRGAIDGMKRIISNAKAGLNQTREEIMKDINGSLRGRASPTGPKPGDVQKGYRFKGGNPADPNSWEKV